MAVPDGSVLGIDALVAFMCAAATCHAVRHCKLDLLFASLALGAGTEFAAIRFGGTHCHNQGVANFAQCSSVNSVLYYGPWVYSSVVSASNLVGGCAGPRWALPWLCGGLTFGMCGVYEMQGPNMRWWKWSNPDSGHIVDFWPAPAQFWQLQPTGAALVIADHAGEALRERVWDLHDADAPGLPVMAPYFDMAFGWGVGFVLWLAPGLGVATCVLLGPLVALLWDLPVRLLEQIAGVDKTSSVPLLMGLSILLPLLLMRGGVRRQPRDVTPDWLLFSIPLANQAFFSHNAITTSPAIIPPSLQLLVLTVAALSLTAHALATGLIGTTTVTSTSTSAHRSRSRSRSASPAAVPSSRTGTAAAAAAGGAGSSSWLDSIQQDAQASELEPANTSPAFFFFLVVAQTAAVAGLCHYGALPSRFHTAAMLCLATHWFGFMLSVLISSDK